MDRTYPKPRLDELTERKESLDEDIALFRNMILGLEARIDSKTKERDRTQKQLLRENASNLGSSYLQLANAMYTKLPREIRDCIYGYLVVAEEKLTVHDWDFKQEDLDAYYEKLLLESRQPDGDWEKHKRQEKEDAWVAQEFGCMGSNKVRDDHSRYYKPDKKLPYTHPEARIYDPDYVGEAIAVEAAEAYYARNVFLVHDKNCARALHRLLTVDRLPSDHRIFNTSMERTDLGIKPSSLIRHIHINISLGDYVSEGLLQPEYGNQRRKLNYLYKKLNSALQLLPDPKRVEVQFTLNDINRYGEPRGDVTLQYSVLIDRDRNSQGISEVSLINMLEALREPVYSLIHTGAKVTVWCHSIQWEFRSPYGIYASRGVSSDLTKIFHLGPAAWQQERDDHEQEWGAYNPELNYIERIKMRNSTDQLYNVIIPRYRRRWGYRSFMALLPGAPANAYEKDWIYQGMQHAEGKQGESSVCESNTVSLALDCGTEYVDCVPLVSAVFRRR